jgi:drug/metabolite transporter (DMT)-like permease
MNSTILIATIAGLCGMLGWGIGDFFAKKTIDIVGDMATLAWAHLLGLTLFVCICLSKLAFGGTVTLPHQPLQLVSLAFFGCLQAFVYFFVYRAFAVGKVSLLNPVFSSYAGLVVLLSIVVFGEAIHASQLLLVIAAFGGVLLMSVEPGSSALKKFNFGKMKGMRDIVVAALLAAVWTLFWARFVAGKDWLIYATIMYAFMSLTVFIICFVQKISLRISDRGLWKYFLFIGIGEVTAYAGISRGYSLTSHISVVAVLSAAFSIPTVLLARVFLHERINRPQVAGIVVVIVSGAVLAAIS